jgi:hypothetical protein
MVELKYGKYVHKLNFSKDMSGLYRHVTELSGKPWGLDFNV